jgi:glutamine cyclotransferase
VLGTGVTVYDATVIVSTYKDARLLLFKLSDLTFLREVKLPMKTTLGLANDGAHLFVTDGSDTITVVDLGAVLTAASVVPTRVLRVR